MFVSIQSPPGTPVLNQHCGFFCDTVSTALALWQHCSEEGIRRSLMAVLNGVWP